MLCSSHRRSNTSKRPSSMSRDATSALVRCEPEKSHEPQPARARALQAERRGSSCRDVTADTTLYWADREPRGSRYARADECGPERSRRAGGPVAPHRSGDHLRDHRGARGDPRGSPCRRLRHLYASDPRGDTERISMRSGTTPAWCGQLDSSSCFLISKTCTTVPYGLVILVPLALKLGSAAPSSTGYSGTCTCGHHGPPSVPPSGSSEPVGNRSRPMAPALHILLGLTLALGRAASLPTGCPLVGRARHPRGGVIGRAGDLRAPARRVALTPTGHRRRTTTVARSW